MQTGSELGRKSTSEARPRAASSYVSAIGVPVTLDMVPDYSEARDLFWDVWKGVVGSRPLLHQDDVWIVRELVKWMIQDEGGELRRDRGILLVGRHGCGKTSLMKAAVLFMRHYVSLISKSGSGYATNTSYTFAFRRVNDILLEVEKANSILALEKYFSGHLCLDDIGQMDENVMTYGTRFNIIETLINRRVGTRFLTLATTNLEPVDIRERYGPVVASRFNQMFTPLVFKSKTDYRKL